MAINLITQPGATTPIGNDDYTQQNLLINGALAQGDEVLTDWAESTAAPAIKQGVYFYHSGNSYQVQDSDSAISGTPVSGANYIGLTESSGVLTASYITDISGYTWNPAYNGLYDGTTLIIRAVTYLIGSAYHRALGADKAQSGMFILADGTVITREITVTTIDCGQATIDSVNGLKTYYYTFPYDTETRYQINPGILAENIISFQPIRRSRTSENINKWYDTDEWNIQSYGLISIDNPGVSDYVSFSMTYIV